MNWNSGDQHEDSVELESDEELLEVKPQSQVRDDIMSYRYFKGAEEEAKDGDDPNFFHNPFNAVQQQNKDLPLESPSFSQLQK